MSEMTAGMGNLTVYQRELLAEWLPDAELVHDHSWGLIGTTALEMSHEGVRYIVKAGDERDHHLARELRAHRLWLEPWVSQGRAPRLLRADDDAKLLLRQYLEGEPVAGSTREYDPDIYHQAGRLLVRLHSQVSLENKEYEAEAKQKSRSSGGRARTSNIRLQRPTFCRLNYPGARELGKSISAPRMSACEAARSRLADTSR